MNPKLRTSIWVVLILGVTILVVWGVKNNPEWRAFSWHGFVDTLLHVHWGYLLVGLALTLLCYPIRALRWREFLYPIKRASLGNLCSAVVIGFTAVTLLGRAGEVSRPFVLSRKEHLPLSIALTTVLMERLFDFTVILILYLLALPFFQLSETASPRSITIFHLFTRGAAILLVILVSVTACLFLFQMNAVRWIDFLIERTWVLPRRFKVKIERALKSFVEGLAFIAHPRPLLLSLFYSFVLWLVGGVAIYFIVRAFMIPFSFAMSIVLLTLAAIGAIIQLPGVGGGFQALTLFPLVNFMGVRPTVASGITLVSWVVVFFPVTVIGLVELFRGGWSLTSLSREAEREAATVLTKPAPALQDVSENV
jgi:uncharacterized protein (TIRG00374 family)